MRLLSVESLFHPHSLSILFVLLYGSERVLLLFANIQFVSHLNWQSLLVSYPNFYPPFLVIEPHIIQKVVLPPKKQEKPLFYL